MSTSYQSNSIAWLIPIPHCTLDATLKSNLASVRLRVALSAEKFIEMGYKVYFCDGEKNIIPEILFIGKFNHSTDEARFNRWIKYINLCKENGTRIITDYTDNHASSNNIIGNFYNLATAVSEKIICSSNRLAKHIQTLGYSNFLVIEDPVEYLSIKPTNKKNIIKRALWFGHASNLQYFINFLVKLQKYPNPIEIVALTNLYPLPDDIIAILEKILPSSINVNILEWSHENMVEVAKISDFCIIPAGIDDDKKNGASSNRLLTALTLGLPVLADPLESYLDFKDHFSELTVNNLNSIIKTPLTDRFNSIETAQLLIGSRFTKDIIAKRWLDLIANMQ